MTALVALCRSRRRPQEEPSFREVILGVAFSRLFGSASARVAWGPRRSIAPSRASRNVVFLTSMLCSKLENELPKTSRPSICSCSAKASTSTPAFPMSAITASASAVSSDSKAPTVP